MKKTKKRKDSDCKQRLMLKLSVNALQLKRRPRDSAFRLSKKRKPRRRELQRKRRLRQSARGLRMRRLLSRRESGNSKKQRQRPKEWLLLSWLRDRERKPRKRLRESRKKGLMLKNRGGFRKKLRKYWPIRDHLQELKSQVNLRLITLRIYNQSKSNLTKENCNILRKKKNPQ